MRIVYAIVSILLLALPAHAGQTLEFGFIDTSLSASSLAVLKAAYAKLDIEVKGIVLPSRRALAEAEAGRTDGETNRIKAIESSLPNLIRIDVPINNVEGLAISCKKSVDTSHVDNIRNLRIGVKIGIRYAEIMTQDMPHVTRKSHEDKLMELLRADRLDIVIGDRTWALAIKHKAINSCMVINEPPLVVIPLYHYLHKRHAALIPQIQRILAEMHDSGEMKIIRDEAISKYNQR